MKRISFLPSGQHQSIKDIAENFETISDSLSYYYTSVESKALNHPLRTEEELSEGYRCSMRELEMMTCLGLLAAIEALFRLDYIARVEKKLKDPMSQDFRRIYNRHKLDVRFDDLIKVWKRRRPTFRVYFERLTVALHFRHWLAHGRYWSPRLGRRHGYLDIYDLASSIEDDVSFEAL
ncbi:hypothetical protein [Pseudomonas rhizoryzae]|uniref:hypothetical protein n=1 Tax=Pseudomonas rhizoryzae TaxID=2571129 RepID=UPI0010C1D22E|nr:hypothetical protein [Pseudomonas rhizoryzae]